MTIMRISRLLTIMLAAAASLTAYGQSIRISEAGVTYVHSSANTGDMTFNGSVLNVVSACATDQHDRHCRWC